MLETHNVPNKKTKSISLVRCPVLGCCFPTLIPLPPLAVAVQAETPHEYPEGQHPPDNDGAQVFHPLAHVPVLRFPGEVIPLPVGAATVSVLPSITVVLAVGVQENVSQLRSV